MTSHDDYEWRFSDDGAPATHADRSDDEEPDYWVVINAPAG